MSELIHEALAKREARKAKRLKKRKLLETMGRKKLPSRKTLISQLDKICSLEAKQRHLDEYRTQICMFCSLRRKIPQDANQCFHMLSREHYSTRWLPENCFWSCSSCNILYESDADFVAVVVEWYKKKFTEQQWDWLCVIYHTPIPVSDVELAEKLETKKEIKSENKTIATG